MSIITLLMFIVKFNVNKLFIGLHKMKLDEMKTLEDK